ncbi:MAG: glycosyltransferase, partial [Acidimicrobiales bacterium]
MRILTVSAHYPPNFVSGGTLQPQRISQGLRARGHDVSVYAGWIGDRPPLQSWEDTDDTGMAVRWVVSSPWIGWSDERNWMNPAVTEHFRAHVDALRPDIVHVHALQSLGAGLLPAARSAGARVVVTMHDFWWLCSRQFLVDHDQRPCSLVVEAGVCACEVDVPWRRERAAALATLLGSADLVLAPSASAARVLAANGVAPHRLDVDENGLPDSILQAATGPRAPGGSTDRSTGGSTGGPLRVLYTGGPNPMKGVDVLLDALGLVTEHDPGEAGGIRVSGFGIDEYLHTSGRSIDGLPIDARDPFPPDQLTSVLADHDVLVLPSVMRETHSLITREALAAGLPVVCTDTLGPEEVVRHGVNGLVVPAADAGALASALAHVARDPGLLAELRRGAAEPFAARSIDDQVVGLESRFQQLVDQGPGQPVEVRRQVRDVLFVCGIEGAPLRYRARLPAEALALQGVRSEVRHYRDPELLARASQTDVAVFYRVPATIQVLELIDALHGAGVACAFDVDDLIFDPDIRDEIPALRLLAPDEAALWLQGIERYRTTLEASDAYIGSTPMLVERAAELTGLAAHRFDNGVGIALARAADRELRRPRSAGPLRIGYLSGTTTHDEDWFFVEPAVIEVLDRHPDVELWLGGHLPDSRALDRFGARVVRLPFLAWLELPAVLRDLDVNLSPLAPGSRFNEAKSAIKWLEAALTATPTVASPTGPFRDAMTDPVRGELAGYLADDHD